MFFLDTFLKGLKPRFDDDLVDRLNWYYTPMLMVIMSLTLSAKTYMVGQPIQCWVPAQFTGAWEQYTENYCFVQNTYFLPLTEQIPKSYGDRDNLEIGYYQWVPMVLALQAVLFYMPNMIWRLLNWQSGISVKGIINMALDAKNIEKGDREKNIKIVSSHIMDSLEVQRRMQAKGRFCGILFYGRHYGAYVSGLYLFTKLLYIANVVCQFFILNTFIAPNYRFWGFEILRDLINGREWQESGHFPRVTMCDFEIRVLGNLHRWTVQCVLMINMYNEKIYLFLWFWFLVVAVFTVANTIYWITVSMIHALQRQFIHRFLRVSEGLGETDGEKRALEKFVHRRLRPDGVFLLRMIADNTGDLVVNEIVDQLWRTFLQRSEQRSAPSPPNADNNTSTSTATPDTDSELAPLSPDSSQGSSPRYVPYKL